MELAIEDLSKCYGKQNALKHINITLNNGVYGLLGPNGAGKTTLIRILIGVLKQSTGHILLNGKDITQLGEEYLDCIGYLPQYPKFYKNFQVYEFLEYMCVLKGIKKSEQIKRIAEVLSCVNLTSEKKKRIGALSGGMRQRLGIAQAILNNPDILILDEPTAGLDPRERIRFRNIISKLAGNRIIILATHIVSDVEYIANQVVIMKSGNLIMHGKPEELKDKVRGSIYEMLISEEKVSEYMEKYLVSNLIREEDGGVRIKIICQKEPPEKAMEIEPSLEDVFLSVFGGN